MYTDLVIARWIDSNDDLEEVKIAEDSVPYRTVRRFEDLETWQRARELGGAVYKLTACGAMRSDFDLCRQMRRAAVSVLSNIAEGYERGSAKEFHRFLSIAKGSCAEIRAQLYIAYDAQLIDHSEFELHVALTERVGQMIGALRSSVARRIAES